MDGLTRREALAMLACAGVASLTGCTPGSGAPTVSLACGEQGGSYLEFGGLLRDVVADGGRLRVDPRVTEGSVENVGLLGRGEVDLALALADTAATLPSLAELVAIGRVYQNYLQCIVRADSALESLADLAGKRVSLGAAGSGASATATRVLAAAGMASGATAPITVHRPFREAVDDLAAGRLDAFFWSGGIPTPLIVDLAGRLPVALLDTTSALPALHDRGDAYAATVVPAGVYGIPREVATIGIPNLLLARADFSDALVIALVDTLIDRASDLAPAPALSIQYLTPSSLIDTSPVPLHPAASRRYRERYG